MSSCKIIFKHYSSRSKLVVFSCFQGIISRQLTGKGLGGSVRTMLFAVQMGLFLHRGYFRMSELSYEDIQVGGFKHVFSHDIWDNPSHWLSYFSRWVGQPPTSIYIYIYDDPVILIIGRIFCSPILSWHVLGDLDLPSSRRRGFPSSSSMVLSSRRIWPFCRSTKRLKPGIRVTLWFNGGLMVV